MTSMYTSTSSLSSASDDTYGSYDEDDLDSAKQTKAGESVQSKLTYLCPVPGCIHRAPRQYDLNRHVQDAHVAKQGSVVYNCPQKGCSRQGEHGFKSKDHLTEHLRKVHSQSAHYCHAPNCKYTAARQFDLTRHVQDAHMGKRDREIYDCPERGCGR